MNILYINHYAGSPDMGMEFRPYYLAREWVKLGHSVTIIAGDYSHLRKHNPVVVRDFQSEVIDGIEYVWLKTGEYDGNGVQRALSMERFVRKLIVKSKMIAKRWQPDLVIASSTYPLDTYAAQCIRHYSNAKYVHEVHDMWPITLIELGGMSKKNPFVVVMQIAENSFCKNADYVVSLLCAAKDYFISHGMAANKFKCVMNGIVEEEWNNPVPLSALHEKVIERFHLQEKHVICFFGSITKSYAIDYLLKAVELDNTGRIAAVIVGEGNQKEDLISKYQSCENIAFLPKSDKLMIPSLLEKVDSIYIGALKNDMFRFGVCMNKIFDSMMSGKPLLYAVDAPNNFAEEYQCGIAVQAENQAEISIGLNKLLSLDSETLEMLGENGKNAVLEDFTYRKLAIKFLNSLI